MGQTHHWREYDIGGAKPWAVGRRASDDAEPVYALTATGRIRRFGKRSHAFCLAEKLHREEISRRHEELRALGL